MGMQLYKLTCSVASNEQVTYYWIEGFFMFPTNLLEVIRMMMMMTTMMMMMIIIIITIITIVITITIYSSIKREKLLRHVAMVAKILNDNKPKTSLKK